MLRRRDRCHFPSCVGGAKTAITVAVGGLMVAAAPPVHAQAVWDFLDDAIPDSTGTVADLAESTRPAADAVEWVGPAFGASTPDEANIGLVDSADSASRDRTTAEASDSTGLSDSGNDSAADFAVLETPRLAVSAERTVAPCHGVGTANGEAALHFASITAITDFAPPRAEPAASISASPDFPAFQLAALDVPIAGLGYYGTTIPPVLFGVDRASPMLRATQGFSYRGYMNQAQVKALLDGAPSLPGESPRGMPLAAVVAHPG